MQEVRANSSYLSASDQRLHFGLGPAAKVEIIVRWPSGTVDTVAAANVDSAVTIVEGAHSK
jgi:hypothetical protein